MHHPRHSHRPAGAHLARLSRFVWGALLVLGITFGGTTQAMALLSGAHCGLPDELTSRPDLSYSPWLMMTPQERNTAQLAMLLATYQEPAPDCDDEPQGDGACSLMPAPGEERGQTLEDEIIQLLATTSISPEDLPDRPDDDASCSGTESSPDRCQSAPPTSRLELGDGPAPLLSAAALANASLIQRTRTLPLVRAHGPPGLGPHAGHPRAVEQPPQHNLA